MGVGELAHSRTAAKRLNELIVQVGKLIMQLQTRTKQGHAREVVGREEWGRTCTAHDKEAGEGGRKREGVNMWYCS